MWFSQDDTISFIALDDDTITTVLRAPETVWELAWWRGLLWYFTKSEIGWIDPLNPGRTRNWEVDSSPRPILSSDWKDADRAFFCGSRGLYEVTLDGPRLAVPLSAVGGNLIAWIQRRNGEYQLGTVNHIYRWDGAPGSTPEIIHSHEQFFSRGINNAVSFGPLLAITDFPDGVVLWDMDRQAVHGIIDSGSGLRIGGVHKVARSVDDTLYILGTEGVATVDPMATARFFPSTAWGGDPPRFSFFHRGNAFVFTERTWSRMDDLGYVKRNLPRTLNWAGVVDGAHIAYQGTNFLERWVNGSWDSRNLGTALLDVVWTDRGGFAFGADRIFAITDSLELRQLDSFPQSVRLIGFIGDNLYGLTGSNRLYRFWDNGRDWQKEFVRETAPGSLHDFARVGDSIYLAFSSGLMRLTDGGIEPVTLAPGWTVHSLAVSDTDLFALARDESDRPRSALILWRSDGRSTLLTPPHLDLIGHPLHVRTDGHRIGLFGTDGVVLEELRAIGRMTTPTAEVSVTHQDERVEGKRLPNAVQQIRIERSTTVNGIPLDAEYRVNEGTWQAMDASGSATLQIGGHGEYRLEIRPLFPNGARGEITRTSFTIEPPWFLRTTALVGFATGTGLLFCLVYYLRHLSLARKNRWLSAEVKKATRDLQDAIAARTNFLAGISHDIRNPLNGLLLVSESLTHEPPTDNLDPRLEELRELGMAVDRMLGEVLDFASIDQSSIPLTFGPVGVAEVIRTAVHQNQWAIDRHLINVTTKIPEELRVLTIQTDRSWLIQVLSNLVINAIDYSQTERIEVGATLLEDGDASAVLEFFVKDWGNGINEAEKKLIFERFYRGEAGIESGRHGTGLGLAICRDVIHAMGGEIRLEDNHPGGACFYITNRFNKMDASLELDREKILETLRGKSILVVEDLDYNRNAMIRFFSRWGCEVDSTGNGSTALEMLKRKSYFLAMLDWDLPGLSGPQVARRFRQQHPDSPTLLIALTAYTDAGKKQESLRSGMNGYLAKPMTAQRLAFTLATIQSDWKRNAGKSFDQVDTGNVNLSIHEHILTLLRQGRENDLEGLKRTAHRLTTLALISGNAEMQRICRDLQEYAQNGQMLEVQMSLLVLHKWKSD